MSKLSRQRNSVLNKNIMVEVSGSKEGYGLLQNKTVLQPAKCTTAHRPIGKTNR